MKDIEDRLYSWYREGAHISGGSLWPRILEKLNTETMERGSTNTKRKSISRRRKIALLAARFVSAAAIVAGLGVGSLYFSPRLDVIVYAMMNHPSTNQSGLQSVLLNDPGLGALWHTGAIHPVELTVIDQGIRMTLLGIWTDANRTIVLYHLNAQQSSTVPVASPWTIITDNSLRLSLSQIKSGAGGMQTTRVGALKKYPVTLSDQFGIARPMTEMSSDGSGYGYLQFPAFTAPERSAGLRLTLRVSAMQQVLAPQGPLEDKQVVTRVGDWTFHFDYVPQNTPALVLAPNTSTTIAGDTITLTSVKTTASETQLELESSKQSFTVMATFHVVSSAGHIVQPIEWSASGRHLSITLPPLTSGGTYTLVDQRGGAHQTGSVIAHLYWTQPAWKGNAARFVPSNETPPLYKGNDWTTAVRSLGYPVLSPPKGYVVNNIVVNDTWQQAVSGRTLGPVPVLTMNIMTPSGAVIQGTEGRTFPTFLPTSESLAQFQASLKTASNSPSLSTVDLGDGRKGYLLSFDSQNVNGPKVKLYWLTVVLPWGNVTFGTTPEHASVSPTILVNTARAWLAPNSRGLNARH